MNYRKCPKCKKETSIMYSGNNQTRIACSCGYELLLANTPTPPVNESWEAKREELADILRKYDCNDSYLFGSLEVFFKNALSTARQEAHSVGKRSGMEELYRELMKTIAFPDWQKGHMRKVLEIRLERIDSLISKGGTT